MDRRKDRHKGTSVNLGEKGKRSVLGAQGNTGAHGGTGKVAQGAGNTTTCGQGPQWGRGGPDLGVLREKRGYLGVEEGGLCRAGGKKGGVKEIVELLEASLFLRGGE